MEKRWLETLMTKEAALDFGLDINKLVKVRRKDGTYYVYKEEVSKEMYKKINHEYWVYQKRRQREFEYLEKQGIELLSLDECKENMAIEAKSEDDLEDIAITRLMIEVLQEEINQLSDEERKLMDLVFHTDLSQRKLAEILGVTQKTISNRIKKNIENLKNKLLK
jgi:RNA polymerase sigma factor (sigma-70 family)